MSTPPPCVSNCTNAQLQAIDDNYIKQHPYVTGLSLLGSASGLIYGVVNKKRWWVVLLLMVGGGWAGSGIGYVFESNTQK